MSHYLIYRCDRCKKEVKQIYDVGNSIELCKNCYRSFKRWWKNEYTA